MGSDGRQYPVVDKNDQVLYHIVGKDSLHEPGSVIRHRSIHVFVEMFGGKILIQKKAAHTENGGLWSSAVSGHVETFDYGYEGAAVREAKEELGLEIVKGDLVEICTLPASIETGWEFVKLFTYLMDDSTEKINLESDEVDEILVLPRKDLMNDIREHPEVYSSVFIELMDRFTGRNK